MNKNIKIILAILFLVIVGLALYFGDAINFKGALKKVDRPDLIARISSIDPTSIGQPATISATIENIGNVNSSGFTVVFYINNELLIQRSISAVNAHGEVYQNEQWTPQTAGAYSIRVCADKYNLIRELSESNNCETMDIYVPEPTEASGSSEGGASLGENLCYENGDCPSGEVLPQENPSNNIDSD